MRLSILSVLLVLIGCAPQAEAPPSTADEEAAIDALYDRFSEAYRQLDAQAVGNLYTEDGLYLSGSEVPILRGRDAITDSFQWLTKTREAGGSRTIAFRSVDRTISGDLAYDVGYYRSTTTTGDGDTHTGGGKFTTVLKKQDGAWRFHVDSYSAAPVDAFDAAPAN